MSLFRRPTEDSFSSDTDDSDLEDEGEEELEQSHGSGIGSTGTEEATGPELTTTETLSTNDFSVADAEDGASIPNADRHRNLMLAALLEEFYKTKAAELINEAQPGANYTRNSPEVQDFARSLYSTASKTLSGAGLLQQDTVTEEQRSLRSTYITGLNNINISQVVDNELMGGNETRRLSATAVNGSMALVRRGSHQPVPFTNSVAGQFNQLAYETNNISLVPHPTADLQLFSSMPNRVSHYQSTFEERGLLGKGGFGRVYHTYNVFDRREYAVKKIPLSPRLSQRYRQGGHQELSNILREVQALARLDHCNVVRYYATWIEEPSAIHASSTPVPQRIPSRTSVPNQRLLDNRPAGARTSMSRVINADLADESNRSADDPFDRDGGDDGYQIGLEWSVQQESHNHHSVSAVAESDIFSDGHAHHQASKDFHQEDSSVYVLHVQMSMYPMTLSQYLAPVDSSRSKSAFSSGSPTVRHCFHLVPALRILLSILCGLQYIHANGLVHRDIKPSNIFISSLDYTTPVALMEGFADVGSCISCQESSARYINPRIGDFGLVAELERAAAASSGDSSSPQHSRSGSGSTRAVGTEYYRPPMWNNNVGHESTRGKKAVTASAADEKLDVFALGVVLMELLWRCGTRMERIDLLEGCQKGRIPALLADKLKAEGHDSETIEQVETCIRGMIEPDPSRRWSCDIVKDSVQTLLTRCNDANNSIRNSLYRHQHYQEEVD